MSTIFIQFSDATGATIVSWFTAPQDAQAFPNQGEVAEDDPRWIAYLKTLPETARSLLPGAVPAPAESELLADAQATQLAAIDAAYDAYVCADISFQTAAGIAATFQADAGSQTVLMQATQGYHMAGSVPAGFFWKAADNTLVDFTLADLEGLYAAVLARGWVAFQRRATLKAAVIAATAVEVVEAIVWA